MFWLRPTQSLPEMAAKLPTMPPAHSNQYNTFMDEVCGTTMTVDNKYVL